uniref:Odorant receptor n=1 Tax=Heliconius melpomene rosina TaxID=171916 RepID=A0A1S5XXM9_HELME|nr:olfactory receptor 33 [Heliconius melpomene rosina]
MDQIRKFGLEYCDLPTMLWNVSIMLRILTLNIDKRNTKRIPTLYYIFTAVVITSYIYVYNISVVWYSFFYCRTTPTCYRLSSIIVFSLGVASSIGVCKLFFMYLYEDKIRDIAAECLLCDAKTIPGSRFEINILKTMRFIKKRAMIFWIVIISNGVVYFLKPLLIPGRHFSEDDLIVLGLDPVLESPNYEIAFALTTAGIFVTVYLPSNITGFLIIVTGYIEAQILALSEEIIQLWVDAENNYINTVPVHNEELPRQEKNKEKAINEFINNRLKDIVKIHIININIFHQVEDVFRGAIAIEFTLLMISLTAVLLGGLENTYMQIPFGLMQVAVDCFTGQRVIDACVTFERAIYSCQWENFDVKNMKIVLLLLQNSMKTLKLSAGGLSTLSFPCFMSVLNSIYSAFTTLHSTL